MCKGLSKFLIINRSNKSNRVNNLTNRKNKLTIQTNKMIKNTDLSNLTNDQKRFRMLENERLERLQKAREKYVITDKYLEMLRKCEGKYEIIFIVDNSESMNQPVGQETLKSNLLDFVPTKWYDLQSNLAPAIIDVAGIMDRNGIEVCFINPVHPDLVDPLTGGTTVRNVVCQKQLDPYFQSVPNGQTPLEHVFKVSVERKLRTMDASTKLIVIIATDGEPTKTDSNGVAVQDIKGFKKMLKNRPYSERVFVSFVACSDDPQQIGYLKELDREIDGIDSNDNYETELIEVKKHKGKNFDFGYGVYIVKVLCGSFIKELDMLNKKNWSLFSK